MSRTSLICYLNGEKLELTLREYEVLKYLTENAGTVCSKEKMFEEVWGFKSSSDMRTLCARVKRLRDKLGEDKGMIQTVRGIGYRMVKA